MKKIVLFYFLIGTCLSAYSQNDFADIKKEVNRWESAAKSSSALTKKNPKSIDFSAQHYLINGIVTKGKLREGTMVKFYETKTLVSNLLLEGVVSYQSERLMVTGTKYIKTPTGTNKIHGTFFVYNMNDYTMKYKPKKAGALRIKSSGVSFLEGFYMKCPTIVKIGEKTSVYVDGKTGGRGYSFLSAVIPNIKLNDDDSFDIYQILLQVKDDVTIYWEGGMMYKGSVKPTPMEDGYINFQKMYGQITGGNTGPKTITVHRENGNIVYTQEDDNINPLMLKEVLYVKDDKTLSDYWDLVKVYKNCFFVKLTYRNGRYFEGSVKTTVKTAKKQGDVDTIFSSPSKGVFKYPNGDRFEGDMSTEVGPFFVDGTTFFVDGSKVKGNWFSQYKLNKNQWEEVYKCQNPSDAKVLADKLAEEYKDQIEQEKFQALKNRVKDLGVTPYKKAILSSINKCLERLERECWVSGNTILSGEMGAVLLAPYMNMSGLILSLDDALSEAALKSPTRCKSIVSDMINDLEHARKLAQPIEIELEKKQLNNISRSPFLQQKIFTLMPIFYNAIGKNK